VHRISVLPNQRYRPHEQAVVLNHSCRLDEITVRNTHVLTNTEEMANVAQ